MIDFDEAINRLMKSEGLDRGAAVARLQEAYDDEDPELQKVSNVGINLLKERVSSVGRRAATGVVEGLTDIPSRLVEATGLDPSGNINYARQKFLENITGGTEPTKYAEGAGELVGGAAAWWAPFEATEAAIGKAAETFGPAALNIPLVRRAVAGGLLGYADTRTGEGAKWGAAFGAFGPPVVEGASALIGSVGGAIGEKLGTIFGRPSPETPVEAEFSHVAEEPEQKFLPPSKTVAGPEEPPRPINLAKGQWTEGGPAFTMTEPAPAEPPPEFYAEPPARTEEPIPKPVVNNISGETLPWAPPTSTEIKNPSVRISPDMEYVGTRDVKTGQPFSADTTVELSNGTFVNPTHEAAAIGTPKPVAFKKAMVLNVKDQPYRDALEQLFPNAPGMVDLHDSHETPDEFARESIGRFARRKGYDGVVLKGTDPTKDIILDFTKFKAKPKALPSEIVKKVREAEPPKTIFARAFDPPVRDWLRPPVPKTEFEGYERPLIPVQVGGALPQTLVANLPETMGESAATISSKTPRFDVETPQGRDLAAQHFGFRDAKQMAGVLRSVHMTPFEAYKRFQKVLFGASPPIRVGLGASSSSLPELRDAVSALAKRHPRLMSIIGEVRVVNPAHHNWYARVSPQPDGSIKMEVNRNLLPDSQMGRHDMAVRYNLGPSQGREYIMQTLEHELTHVAQFWLDARELRGAFGVPMMGVGKTVPTSKEEAEAEKERSEAQAESRAIALTKFFQAHSRLQQVAANIPEHVQTAVLRAHALDEVAKMRPAVLRRVNQLRARPQTIKYERKFDPKNMDLFDNESRNQPLGSSVAPDDVLGPEIKDFIAQANRYGLKHPASLRLPYMVTDDPKWVGFVSGVYEDANQMQATIDRLNKKAAKIFNDYGVDEKNYDKLWEAVQTLRRQPDGSLIQTATGVDAKTDKAARALREGIYDPAFEHITGVNRKAPALIREKGLEPNEKQLWRLKLLQEGQRAKVKDPTLDEFSLAAKLRGMLNFDESNDLRMEFVEGYITHQPIQNERAQLMDDIRTMQLTQQNSPQDKDVQDRLQQRIKRLEQIEIGMARQKVRGMPARDLLPKKHFFGPVNVKDHPGAAEILVDKNLPHVTGRYIAGIASKRFMDKTLHGFRSVADLLSPAVRDYGVNYVNNIRGVRGLREDAGINDFLNTFNKALGGKRQVTVRQMQQEFGTLMKLTTWSKLLLTPVRFPLVLMSHLGMTTFPVAGPRSMIKGMAYALANPKRATAEAMAQGIVDRDPEFLGIIDESKASTQSSLLKLAQAPSKYADWFRKVVTYHTFRLQALEPGFKPDPLIRTFVKDVPGRSTIKMARDYAKAATDRTQFRLRAEGKPQAFVGGTIRRGVGLFKTWPINIGSLYGDILKNGTTAQKARVGAALWFFGGNVALLGGGLLYHAIRSELIKRFGFILDDRTGYQQIGNWLGFGSYLDPVDLTTFRDPIGLPRTGSVDDIAHWLAGPMISTIYDTAKAGVDAVTGDDTGKALKEAISAISPQARAAIDSYEELQHGGMVRSELNKVLAKQDLTRMVIRGLDLSPSVKSQRYQYIQDITDAMKGGHRETVRLLLNQAHQRGVVFSRRDIQSMRSQAKHYQRLQRVPFGQALQ